jgi:hypothetical protein
VNIFSETFKESEFIPREHSCDGADRSPALRWDDVPEGTRSFALICDDPDALGEPWVHWVIYNIPASASSLPAHIPAGEIPEVIGIQGLNSWGNIGYGGPCPPGDTHRYYFRLYALDTSITASGIMNKASLLSAMKCHILGEAELMGRYSRN